MEPESNHPHRRPIVLYDGRCPVCCRSLTMLAYVDRDEHIARLNGTSIRASPLMATISPAKRGRAVHVLESSGHVQSGGDALIVLIEVLYGGRLAKILRTWPASWMIRASYLLLAALRGYLKGFTGWIPITLDDNYRNSDWPLLSRSPVLETERSRYGKSPTHSTNQTSRRR